MKMHLNLTTTDLEQSVAFYTTLLNTQPAKVLGDYALFITEDPGLELALDLSDTVSAARDAHYGIYVDTAKAVERAVERLQSAGLAASVEREETCCYATQTKVWAIDPEGRRWEVYTVHEDTESRDGGETPCCALGECP